MKKKEINGGVILTNITSNRIAGEFTADEADEGFYKFKELPPHIVGEPKRLSYKHLGIEKALGGETIDKLSVRKRRKSKHGTRRKHFTLKWSGVVKTDDIQDIKKEGRIIEKHKLVTSRLRLPKKAIRNLIVDFNEFLYPPKKPVPLSELFEILRQPYALDIVKHFSENEEMTVKEFREITKLSKNKTYKYLNSFEKLGLLRKYKCGRDGMKIYGITLEKERIAKIMNIFRD